jgi:hypothetical protein
MPITFRSTNDEQKIIRKLRKGQIEEEILTPIWNSAVERAGRRFS